MKKKRAYFYILICNAVATILAAVSLLDYIKKGDKFHVMVTGLCVFLFFTAFIIFLLEYKKYTKSASNKDSLKSNPDTNIADQVAKHYHLDE
jgi:hypothetical protein